VRDDVGAAVARWTVPAVRGAAELVSGEDGRLGESLDGTAAPVARGLDPFPLGAGFFRKMAGATAMTIMRSIAHSVRQSMTQFTGSGNGIKATGIEGVASSQPAGSQPASSEHPMARYRLQGVLGAGWGKSAAGGEQRRHQDLISPDKTCREVARPH
jgi:NADH:ubiquinone oxidoreductase subunit F (NADH-binding)